MAGTITEQNILYKRARKKYISSALSHQLVRVDNEYKPYILSCGCCNTLEIDNDNVLKSRFYCKRRWCSTCASIMAATLINKYLPIFKKIEKLDDLYFVTLTKPTIPADKLEERLSEMQYNWRKIADLARKKRNNFIGIRKTELKVSAGNENLYHPHYHIIVVGESNAKWLVDQWLQKNKDAGHKSQDARKILATENALLEIFKYSTKITAADNAGNVQLAPAWKLDKIYKALFGKRIYQGFGGLTMISDGEDFETTAETVIMARGVYEWHGTDWYHTDYAIPLTNWIPTAEELALKYWSPKKTACETLELMESG